MFFDFPWKSLLAIVMLVFGFYMRTKSKFEDTYFDHQERNIDIHKQDDV